MLAEARVCFNCIDTQSIVNNNNFLSHCVVLARQKGAVWPQSVLMEASHRFYWSFSRLQMFCLACKQADKSGRHNDRERGGYCNDIVAGPYKR